MSVEDGQNAQRIVIAEPGAYRYLIVLRLEDRPMTGKQLAGFGPPGRHEDCRGQLAVLEGLGLTAARRPRVFAGRGSGVRVSLTDAGRELADILLDRSRKDEDLRRKAAFVRDDPDREAVLRSLLFGRNEASYVRLMVGLGKPEAEMVLSDLAREDLAFTVGSISSHTEEVEDGDPRTWVMPPVMAECGPTGDGLVVAHRLAGGEWTLR